MKCEKCGIDIPAEEASDSLFCKDCSEGKTAGETLRSQDHDSADKYRELVKKRSKTTKLLTRALNFLSGFVGGLVIIAGCSIFIYQVYTYLRKGVWIEFPLMLVYKYFDISWIDNPTSWYGLHKLMVFLCTKISISFILVLLGLGIISSAGRLK